MASNDEGQGSGDCDDVYGAAKIIDKKEPYSEIVKDNPTITEEQFQIFKEACEAEAAKKSLST